jgi:hypothetical protein
VPENYILVTFSDPGSYWNVYKETRQTVMKCSLSI